MSNYTKDGKLIPDVDPTTVDRMLRGLDVQPGQIELMDLGPTLRDRFAMAALPFIGERASDPRFIAVEAYSVADAMLEERKRNVL